MAATPQQSHISRYLIPTPRWIPHKVALVPSDYPDAVMGAGNALPRRSSSRANSEVPFAGREGKEAFPSRPGSKTSPTFAACTFRALREMTASIIFLSYFFLNRTNVLLSEHVGAATIQTV